MGMEKRLVLAVVLMIATVFIVNILFPPPPPPELPDAAQEMAATPVDAAETVPESAVVPQVQPPTTAAQPTDLPGLAPAEQLEAEDTVWVTGPLYRLGFAHRGGRLVSAQMLQFESLAEDNKGEPVELVPALAENFFTHRWMVGDDTLDLSKVRFEMSPPRGLNLAEGGASQTLTLTYQPEGVPFRLDIEYTFHPDRYLMDLHGRVQGVRATGWWGLGLGPGLLSNEWDPENDYKSNLAFTGKGPEGVASQKIGEVEGAQRIFLDGPFDWAAVRTKYFVAALVLHL
ncbi:MAG TPA: membrane protein insertase YidC, partial [Gemmatimonadota bacterium]|nr:membrane protein insertase YidC [Gemmatimonadota bacterium]